VALRDGHTRPLRRSLGPLLINSPFLKSGDLNNPCLDLLALRLHLDCYSLTFRYFRCFLYSFSLAYSLSLGFFESELFSDRLSYKNASISLFFSFTGFFLSRYSYLKLFIARGLFTLAFRLFNIGDTLTNLRDFS
jgi:hypothetical protein